MWRADRVAPSLPGLASFCNRCGAAVADPPAPAPRFASPRAYTPATSPRRSWTSAALEGERKQVTVLFADMVGSTELLADRDPEEARGSSTR